MELAKPRIVIIDLNEETAPSVVSALQVIGTVDIKTETHDLMKGYDLIKSTVPQIVILHLHPDEEAALMLATKTTQNFPAVTLMVISKQTEAETVIRSMRAGAREFFPLPLKNDDLLNAVKTVLHQKAKESTLGRTAKGKIISVYGTKGGVGTTTVATNIATSLVQESRKDVLLMDLNLQFGHVALYLNIKSRYSIVEVAKNLAEVDLQLLKSTLPKHESGLKILTGPLQIEEAEFVTADHVEKILASLKSIFDYIVIDTFRAFNDTTLKALDEADTIVLISELDVGSIFNTNRIIELFKRIGYSDDKLKLVLNRYGKMGETDPAVLEKLIEHPIFYKIPLQDYDTIMSSINRGIPITLMMPNLKISKNYCEIAQRLNGGLKKAESSASGERTVLFKRILSK